MTRTYEERSVIYYTELLKLKHKLGEGKISVTAYELMREDLKKELKMEGI